MEDCFQILEKNKILVKTENLCRPAPYQRWEKGAFFWYVRFISYFSTNFSPARNFQLFNFLSLLKKFSAFPKFGNFGQFKTKTILAFQLLSQLKIFAKIFQLQEFLAWPAPAHAKFPAPIPAENSCQNLEEQ